VDHDQEDPVPIFPSDHTFVLTHLLSHLADTSRNGSAALARASVSSALAKTTLGKRGPDLAGVSTASEGLVGIEDGVTSLDEVRVAGLTI